MIFNSIPFIVFALLFFAAWPWVQKNNNAKWLWICTMSFVFYAWWDWRFMFRLYVRATNLPFRKAQEILVNLIHGDQYRLALFFQIQCLVGA